MTVSDVRSKLAGLPERPGVYIFRDDKDRVLYVGKAKSLRSRVRSYFQVSASLDERKKAMMAEVCDFEYTVTDNELEAFVLEANLIKRNRPRYNVLLRDDKSYPYLKLTVNERWPRLEVVRRIARDGARYFGPYVPAGAMWETLSFIRKTFPIRQCSYSLDRPMRPCIQYQIKRCSAPCAGLVGEEEYRSVVEDVRLLLEGRNSRLLRTLNHKMQALSDELSFEEAARVRDRIRAIEKISESQRVVSPALGDVDAVGMFRGTDEAVFKLLFVRGGIMIGSRHLHLGDIGGYTDADLLAGFISQFYRKEIIPPEELLCQVLPEEAEMLASWLSDKRASRVRISAPKAGVRRDLLDMACENARILLKSGHAEGRVDALAGVASLLGLESVPADAGCFDISNIGGREAVGSFVYWADGGFRKDRYRHIRMEAVQGPDDYGMMKEMIRRTTESLEGELPDLIIIDGGMAHLDAAMSVLEAKERTVISVAKAPDRAFLKGRSGPVDLSGGDSPSLFLRKIRDEAHRFAVGYHKKLRSRRTLESPLEKVQGIGRKRRLALLRHFGSLDAIRAASIEDIAVLKGFNKALAGRIIDALRKSGEGVNI